MGLGQWRDSTPEVGISGRRKRCSSMIPLDTDAAVVLRRKLMDGLLIGFFEDVLQTWRIEDPHAGTVRLSDRDEKLRCFCGRVQSSPSLQIIQTQTQSLSSPSKVMLATGSRRCTYYGRLFERRNEIFDSDQNLQLSARLQHDRHVCALGH